MSPQRPQSCGQSLCHRPSSPRLCQVSKDLPHLPLVVRCHILGSMYSQFPRRNQDPQTTPGVSSWGHSVTIMLSPPCPILPPMVALETSGEAEPFAPPLESKCGELASAAGAGQGGPRSCEEGQGPEALGHLSCSEPLGTEQVPPCPGGNQGPCTHAACCTAPSTCP